MTVSSIHLSLILVFVIVASHSQVQGRIQSAFSKNDSNDVGIRRNLTNQNDSTSTLVTDQQNKYHQLHVPHRIAQSRIIGGTNSNINAYPFYVSWDYSCGASLISNEWLLTAAHCNPIQSQSVQINQSRIYGIHGRGISNTIVQRIPHPLYDVDGDLNHDFMLMKLQTPVTDRTIRTIALNRNEAIPANHDPLKVIGFGALSSGGHQPANLQEVIVRYIPTEECNAPESYDGDVLDETMFCAGILNEGGKDSCQGDSGGPIFKENIDGSFTQMGVVSWGIGCAGEDHPGVYARISGAMDWIHNTICNDRETLYKPDFCGQDGEKTKPPADDDDDDDDDDNGKQRPVADDDDDDGGECQDDVTLDFLVDETGDTRNCQWLATNFGKFDYLCQLFDVAVKCKDTCNVCHYEDKKITNGRKKPRPVTDDDDDDDDDDRKCRDDSVLEFLVDQTVGSQSCQWLASNLENFGFLCQFFDVASKCKDTCNVCHHF